MEDLQDFGLHQCVTVSRLLSLSLSRSRSAKISPKAAKRNTRQRERGGWIKTLLLHRGRVRGIMRLVKISPLARKEMRDVFILEDMLQFAHLSMKSTYANLGRLAEYFNTCRRRVLSTMFKHFSESSAHSCHTSSVTSRSSRLLEPAGSHTSLGDIFLLKFGEIHMLAIT